ncbi:hypothetical protein K450DRAFT_238068 [Umbelopsis ramanniana AG]|uniref:Uncharacterized protein n=1 Tax=Umbelopsis ramanniana AG TaxID=1314678 RepID=A0AAD5EBH4_UMBRA|nr:uncharacterized protein K450DRAFT_238068 [Umbelopsis ramanniana AG]KAI8580342.1 hypothetical protein K450DRAFT_238068 [Umbelopsis ramanniana AG]
MKIHTSHYSQKLSFSSHCPILIACIFTFQFSISEKKNVFIKIKKFVISITLLPL